MLPPSHEATRARLVRPEADELPRDGLMLEASVQTTGSLWWRRRVIVVAETPERARHIIGEMQPLQDLEPPPSYEFVGWPEATRIRGPLGALLVDVHDPPASSDAFDAWSERAWQAVTVVLLSAASGTTRLANGLRTDGFRHLFRALGEPPWGSVRGSLGNVLSRETWIVGWFARELNVPWTGVGTLLEAALTGEELPDGPDAWARRADLYLWEHERLLADRGLIPPRRLLPRLRVWRAVVEARIAACRPTRNQLARQVGYATGDYLGRRARALTGLPFGDLLGLDLGEVVGLLASGVIDPTDRPTD